MNYRCIIVISLVLISMLFFSQLLSITAEPYVTDADADNLVPNYSFTANYWNTVAQNAWRYYEPGVGVHEITGLHNTCLDPEQFTDWDLGTYILAIVDVTKLGLINFEGDWGFDYRINKILNFLETRPLASNGVPYVWYSSTNGVNIVNSPQYATDAAFLLLSLKIVSEYRSVFAQRINNIVNVKTTYEPLKQAVDGLTLPTRQLNTYDYFTTAGFASFWPERFNEKAEILLNNILSAPTTTYQGINLPHAWIGCEPLMLSVFAFNDNANDNLLYLMSQAYLAHEARYNTTGKYVAFSEGNPKDIISGYVWEWVASSDGRTWVTYGDEQTEVFMSSPAVFLKTAIGFAAMYSTPFTQSMVNWLEPAMLSNYGYFEGKSEDGAGMYILSDKTNGLIINAARYAIENQNPTLTLTPTPTTALFTPTPTSQANLTPNATSTFNPTELPTYRPQQTSIPSHTPTSISEQSHPPTQGALPTPSLSSYIPSPSPIISPYTTFSPLFPSPTSTHSTTLPTSLVTPSIHPSSTTDQLTKYSVPWYNEPLLIVLLIIGALLTTIILLFNSQHKLPFSKCFFITTIFPTNLTFFFAKK